MTIDIATGVLALRPRDGFDLDAAGGAIDPAHGVGKRDGDVPDRDEFKLSGTGHSVVSGTLLSTTRAPGFTVSPGGDVANDSHRSALSAQSDGMVNEALEAMDFVE